MTAQITISLELPEVEVVKAELSPQGDGMITVASTRVGTRWRKCGRAITELHGRDEGITLRHLPILGRCVYLHLRPKRYRCFSCEGGPTTTQALSWYEAKSPHTKAHERYLLLQLVHATIEDVSSKEVTWAEVKGVKVLGLAEIALKKGHRDFVVIVTAKVASGDVKVLAVLPDRQKQTVRRFLEGRPQRGKRSIRTVCPDLYDGFIAAVKEVLGHAEGVADRFQVANLYRAGADHLRKQELKRLKRELPKAEYATLKGALWAFRKKPADVEGPEHEVLHRLFAYAPDLARAYTYREQLTAIFEEDLSKDQATPKLQSWQEQGRASGLQCYEPFLTTLEPWRDEITHYFRQRHNRGFVEGLNNKIKGLKRRCYGIFNLAHLFQRISLDLEGYRLFANPVG